MEIRCHVESCRFWVNNLCQAGAILVESRDARQPPSRSDHTMCSTFKEEQ